MPRSASAACPAAIGRGAPVGDTNRRPIRRQLSNYTAMALSGGRFRAPMACPASAVVPGKVISDKNTSHSPIWLSARFLAPKALNTLIIRLTTRDDNTTTEVVDPIDPVQFIVNKNE